jgi:addiction module HigA family antidote
VIRGFRHRGLKHLFEEGDHSRIHPDLVEKVENILSVLDTASAPHDLNLPGYRLHPLKGDRKGYWAITVRANWRIVFRMKDGDAFEIDFLDYH